MLTGKALGAAIKDAIDKKQVRQTEVARHFGIKPPSIQTWIVKGTVAKEKLPELWQYFSDVVGPSHWGLERFPWTDQAGEQSQGHFSSEPGAEGVTTNVLNEPKGTDVMYQVPTLGATILHLGALLAALSPMGQRSVRTLIESVLDNPDAAIEAARVADAIATTQRLPVGNEQFSESFGKSQRRPTETTQGPLR